MSSAAYGSSRPHVSFLSESRSTEIEYVYQSHISSAPKLTDFHSMLLIMDLWVAKFCTSISFCVEVLDFTDLGEKSDAFSLI